LWPETAGIPEIFSCDCHRPLGSFVHSIRSSVPAIGLDECRRRTSKSWEWHGVIHFRGRFPKNQNKRSRMYLNYIKFYVLRDLASETGCDENLIPLPYDWSYNCRSTCWLFLSSVCLLPRWRLESFWFCYSPKSCPLALSTSCLSTQSSGRWLSL
jgi:hypothetical protein